MAEGRQRDQWNHTAQVLSMLYNAHRDRRARFLAPHEFHPMLREPVPTTTLKELADLGILKTKG